MAIRSDVYSVKVRRSDSGVNEPIHERMFYSLESARRYSRGRIASSGYSIDKAIVHPADWVVSGYLAAGNAIEK